MVRRFPLPTFFLAWNTRSLHSDSIKSRVSNDDLGLVINSEPRVLTSHWHKPVFQIIGLRAPSLAQSEELYPGPSHDPVTGHMALTGTLRCPSDRASEATAGSRDSGSGHIRA
eukprot:392305-Rhodomonas_salina.1